MPSHTKLNVSNLDFETIKSNLKAFLSSQNEFQNFDFTGSTMDVLLDLLSYNTHYSAFYVNMLANEMFLDSAIIRKNVVAKAKSIGYTPRSVTGAKAELTVQVIPTDSPLPSSVTIDKNTPFYATVNGQQYTFNTTTSTNVVKDSSNNFITTGLEVKQGISITHTYTANTSDASQRFILPNAGTDTSTLSVTIQPNESSTNSYVYTKASDITAVTSTSNVYFLSETFDGKFEIQFGDDVIGRKLSDGNVVILNALISDGAVPNGATNFTPSGLVGGYANAIVTTTTDAYAGAARESIESIKFNAPRLYETQNRAVTINDFKRIITADYSDAESITTWGGEDNDPPVYGKVYIAVKPKTGTIVTDAAKEYVKSIVKNRKIVSVTPEVVSPDYVYMSVTTRVNYNSLTNKIAGSTIAENVKTIIRNYGVNELSKFDLRFRYSKLVQDIDNSDASILGSLTSITLYKLLEVTTGSSLNYTVKFGNEIYHPNDTYVGAITSTAFVYKDLLGITHEECFLDDLNGTLRVASIIAGTKTIHAANVGTVTYGTGKLELQSFNPVSITGTSIKITVTPASSDVAPVREQILLIESNDITVTAVADSEEATGVTTSGSSASTSGSSSGGSAGSGGY